MKKVMMLVVTTFLSKIIAFGKELILAYYYGAGNTSDIYFIALTIPFVIFGFFSSGISSGFVPAYTKAIGDKRDYVEGNKFTNGVITVLLLILIILIMIYFPFNRVIIDHFARGFDDTAKIITVSFSNVMVFSILFSCITTVMSSFLQSKEKTSVIGLLSIPLNVALTISIVLSAIYENVYFLPYGYLIGCVIQAIIFVMIAINNGYEISKNIYIWNENVRFFLSSIIILTIGSSVYQINVLVDKMLASTVAVGGVASLEYGTRIIDLISGLFIISISTVQFPRFVNNNKDKEEISACFREGMNALIVFLIPLSFVLIFFSREIITLVYARGAFGDEAIELTSPILVFYGIGLISIGVRELISKLYYALGDMRTPVINALIGVVLNVILNFVLVIFWGLGGLAFATSITAFVVSVSLLIQIRKRIILQFPIMFYMKILLISIIASVICKVVIECIEIHSHHANVILGVISFSIAYLIGSFLIGVFDMRKTRSILQYLSR